MDAVELAVPALDLNELFSHDLYRFNKLFVDFLGDVVPQIVDLIEVVEVREGILRCIDLFRRLVAARRRHVLLAFLLLLGKRRLKVLVNLGHDSCLVLPVEVSANVVDAVQNR